MADNSKDTGTGGINIDGQLYTPDVGVPDAQGGAQGTYSPGDVAVDKTVKDISRPTRETFAKYLSKTTLGTAGNSPHGNTYPVGTGAATTLQETSLKDANGNPVSPGPQNNEAKFATGFNTSIASNNPVGIRRGLATGTGPDGNTLLPTASTIAPSGGDYVKFVASKDDDSEGLRPDVKAYTANVVKPNLHDYTDYSADKKSANLSGDAQQQNLYDLQMTTDLATDGGKSSNVLDPTKSVSFASEAELVKTLTTINFFPVDSPVVGDDKILKVFKLDSSAVLAKTDNTKSFADVSIGSNPVISKGKLKKPNLPDGNSLLPNASTHAPSDGEYIKFVTSTDEGDKGLQVPIKAYTVEAVEPNLNDYNSKLVKIPEYEDVGAPSDIRDLNKTTTFAADAGTSTHILDGSRNLTLNSAAATVAIKTLNNFFPVNSPVVADKLKVVQLDAANVLALTSNTNYFTAPLKGNYSIGSYTAVNSKGKLKNIGSEKLSLYKDKTLPDGNSLLPTASTPAPSGGPYVKFVTSTNTEGLLEPIKVYTNNLLDDGNIYRPTSGAVINLDNVAALNFFGPKELHRPESGPVDAGTFDNIQDNPSKRAVTKELLFQRAVDEVTGKNAPGNIGNVYKIALVEPSNLFSFTTPQGIPASPTNAQNIIVSLDQYAVPPGNEKSGLVGLQSSYSDDITKLNIRRGKSPAEKTIPDGNTLLKDAAPPVVGQAQFIKTAARTSTAISDYVTAILGKNRYSPLDGKNKFVPNDTPNAESGDFNQVLDFVGNGQRDQSFVYRTKLYSPHELQPGESPQQTINRGTELKGYNFRSLTRIGTLLQFNAAGEIAYLAGYNNNRGNLAELAALAPGLGQGVAGFPLSQEYLKVTEIIKNLPREDDDKNTGFSNEAALYEGELIDFNRHFEGIINTTSEKFSSYSSIAIFVLAILLVVAMILAIQGLAIMLNGSFSQNESPNHAYPDGAAGADEHGVRYFGSFRGRQISGGVNLIDDLVNAFSTGDFGGTLFGIRSTTNVSYRDAVYTGMLSFFGLGKKVPPMLAYPGQVVVTSRAIIRSISQIVKQIIGIGNAFVSGNVLDGIFKLFGIIDMIRNSKLIGALNVFSQLGDRKPIKILSSKYALDYQQTAPNSNNPLGSATQEGTETQLFGSDSGVLDLFERTRSNDVGKVVSEIDSVNDSKNITDVAAGVLDPSEYYGVSHIKSRRQDKSGLAWASYRAPSLFLGSTVADTTDMPGYHAGALSTEDSQGCYVVAAAGNRLLNSTVSKIETMLEGEYLPFYLHDLRTNEIIGFHAFLTSLSDDYTANYESTTGIGRIEPVRTYKDTQRKIGLSFVLPALDSADFDHIWEKINKLTMLMYPQYTSGKIYENPETGYRFEKPFTQQIAASPMVRLRVGNLFRSNYSRFNLAGIFGLHDRDTKLGINDKDAREQIQKERDAKATAAATAKAKANFDQAFAEWLKDPKNKYQAGYSFKVKPGLYFNKISDGMKKKIKSGNAPQQTANIPSIAQTASGKFANLHYSYTPPQQKVNKPAAVGPWYRVTQEGMPENFAFEISDIYTGADDKPLLFKGKFILEGGGDDSPTADRPAGWKANDVDWYVAAENLSNSTESTYDTQIYAAAAAGVKMENQDDKGKPLSDAVDKKTFMDRNSITKSFESAGGKGLAGFIDSMNFDWYDTTWDLDVTRQAPKICKVTIGFSPIHDITPGLDSSGRNRAPIYPLGPYAYGSRSRSYANATTKPNPSSK